MSRLSGLPILLAASLLPLAHSVPNLASIQSGFMEGFMSGLNGGGSPAPPPTQASSSSNSLWDGAGAVAQSAAPLWDSSAIQTLGSMMQFKSRIPYLSNPFQQYGVSGGTCQLINPVVAISIFFDPIQPDDEAKLEDYVRSTRFVCSRNGGVKACRCASDPAQKMRRRPGWMHNSTELFYCMPDKCVCNSGRVERLKVPVEPIGETYTSKINRFCGCRQPSWCECQRKEPHSSIKAPYTFAKILGCLPDYCQCPDGMGRAEAPPAGLFLEPLARSFGKIVGKDVPQPPLKFYVGTPSIPPWLVDKITERVLEETNKVCNGHTEPPRVCRCRHGEDKWLRPPFGIRRVLRCCTIYCVCHNGEVISGEDAVRRVANSPLKKDLSGAELATESLMGLMLTSMLKNPTEKKGKARKIIHVRPRSTKKLQRLQRQSRKLK